MTRYTSFKRVCSDPFSLLYSLYSPSFFVCTYELDSGHDVCSWGDKIFRIHVLRMGSADDEFIDVSGNRQSNPPHGL